MNSKWHILYFIIIAAILYFNSVTPTQEANKIILPEIEGNFKADKIVEEKDTLKKKVIYINKEIEVPSKTNEKLLAEYEKAKDSIDKLNLYISLIQDREYFKTFSDENLEIDVEAYVTGKLNNLDLKYRIKQKEVEIPRKPIVIRGGVKFETHNVGIVPKISLEDRKGTLYTLEAKEKYLGVGVEIPLIKIK